MIPYRVIAHCQVLQRPRVWCVLQQQASRTAQRCLLRLNYGWASDETALLQRCGRVLVSERAQAASSQQT